MGGPGEMLLDSFGGSRAICILAVGWLCRSGFPYPPPNRLGSAQHLNLGQK